VTAVAALKAPEMIRLRPRKPPAQRDYAPKPADPGQSISWARTVGYGRTEQRTGTIWSTGALPSSVWVQPHDAAHGDMALVMLRSMLEHSSYPPSWQHDTIRRFEHLRHSKGLFAEYETVPVRTWGYSSASKTEQRTVAYHSDRACPEIRHETRDCSEWEPNVSSGTVARGPIDKADALLDELPALTEGWEM